MFNYLKEWKRADRTGRRLSKEEKTARKKLARHMQHMIAEACPECPAAAGEPCFNDDGTSMGGESSVHSSRGDA